MYNRKAFLPVYLLIPIFILSGCKMISANLPQPADSSDLAQSSENADTSGGNTESQSISVNCEATPPIGNGFLYDDNLFVSGLTITNVDTGDVQTICNVPGCLHGSNDSNCLKNSYYLYESYSAAYKNHIVFQGRRKGDNSSGTLYYINSDGSGLKALVSWDEYDTVYYGKKVLVDNHMFFSIVLEKTSLDDEEGYVNVDESIVRLYDVNMETGKINLIHESDSSFGAHISQGMLYDNGSVYIEYSLQTRSFEEIGITQQEFYSNYDEYFDNRVELQGIKDFSVVYNLNTQKCEIYNIMYDGREFLAECFWDNKLYTVDSSLYKVICYDIDTGEISTWKSDLNVNTLYQSSDFILIQLRMPSLELPSEYLIMKKGETGLRKYSPEEWDFTICDECPGRLLIREHKGDELLGNYETKDPVYIDRDSFFSWFS